MTLKKAKLFTIFIMTTFISNALGCSKIYNETDSFTDTTTSEYVYTDNTDNTELTDNTNINDNLYTDITEKTDYNKNTNTDNKNIPFMEEHMKFQGRHVFKDDIEWLVQSGSAAEFTVTGTNVSVMIAGDSSIYNESSDYRPRYAVYVDDKLIRDKIIASPEENVILFEESTPRTAEVRIVMLSEAAYGAIGIKDISILGGDKESITPMPQKELAIEFIGDSITCGYGVEGSDGSESFSTSTENFYKSYAYIAANELNADYSVAAYSGYGVIYGCCSGDPNPNETLIKYYDVESMIEPYNDKHDFTKRKMDAVVINLGTNDTCYVDKDDKTTCDEFTAGYIALLKKVRKNNPDSVIICTVGLMGGNESIYPLIENAVKELNDDKITCFLSEHQNMDKNGAGAAYHPSEKTQKQYGHVLAEEIKKAIG